MKASRFTSVLLGGHKGAALEVPFDPAELWSIPAAALRPGRRGHRVEGTIGRVKFKGDVVPRSRRFWLEVDDETLERASLTIGDQVTVALKPAELAPVKPQPPITPKQALQAIDQVRKICLALPETEEKLAWSEPTFRVKKRLFAMIANNHHHDGRIAVWLAAPDGLQREVVASDPKHFFVPPYVGVGGWIGMRIDSGLPWPTVATFLAGAHELIEAKGRRRKAR